jgi:hypothetical protein
LIEKSLSPATEKEGMKQRDTKIVNRKNIFRIAICHYTLTFTLSPQGRGEGEGVIKRKAR